ncbi:hypothetical protein N7G274_008354, partial [Stereocaulon virgatum]
MPCTVDNHNHGWATVGILPASVLRKHVMTHIRNHSMPLVIQNSTGGRPRKRAVVSTTVVADSNEVHTPGLAAVEDNPIAPQTQNEGQPILSNDAEAYISLPTTRLSALGAINDSLNSVVSSTTTLSRPNELLDHTSNVVSQSTSCWKCKILRLQCNGAIPCSTCDYYATRDTCHYRSFGQYLRLVFGECLNYRWVLQWKNDTGRALHTVFSTESSKTAVQAANELHFGRLRLRWRVSSITESFALLGGGCNAFVDVKYRCQATNIVSSAANYTSSGASS